MANLTVNLPNRPAGEKVECQGSYTFVNRAGDVEVTGTWRAVGVNGQTVEVEGLEEDQVVGEPLNSPPPPNDTDEEG